MGRFDRRSLPAPNLPVRADSLLGLVRPAPAVPNPEALDLGIHLERFLLDDESSETPRQVPEIHLGVYASRRGPGGVQRPLVPKTGRIGDSNAIVAHQDERDTFANHPRRE